MISYSSIRQTTINQFQQLCHRGFPLRVWLDDQQNLSTIACLCPPSFYGDMCQYQNQRVSLTMRFQAFSDSRRTLFAIIVSLIDDSDKRIIHSYQQFTYLYIRDCQKKFNIYLLYSTRPKHSGKNYSLHIDIYDKMLLKYRGSILIPLEFSFLPVHRIAVQLTIPPTSDRKESCLDQQCMHDQCIRYSNDRNPITFCQCYQGWVGKYCATRYNCTCSPGSLYVGISSNNRSICVCPLNKWGSQCYLHNTICNSDNNVTCYNNGQCIPIDENIASTKQFVCICRKGFGGERCEIVDKKIILSFDEDINLSEKILIHFIRVFDNAPPENGSTFTTIPPNQNLITIQWSRPFHIAFLEIFRNYYLITVQKIYNQSKTIDRKMTPSDRCKHLNEILNETIVNLHLLRRIKYYHLACQKHSPPLSCFYDNTHFCLCTNYGNQRQANCFEFNPSIERNCIGQSNCENGAQCLQDRNFCPQTSMCICPKCFHGARCQFSSNLLDLSFDTLLGYHIQLHTNIKHQPSIIKFSVALTTIMILVGLINSILSILTFKSEELRQIGCGIYLLTSSIISFITLIIFALKFWILMITQMSYITNRTFLYGQCVSIDFLLRICITMNQWLNACVAGERVYTIMKGTSFNKNKSKQVAKYAIFVLLVLSIGTIIHDPIRRSLLDDYDDDVDENRIWCIVNYSPSLQTFNSAMLIFHFLVSFLVNIGSAFIIIFAGARQRTTVQTQQTYWQLLHKQFQQHYHLLIAPICLVILALPNIILSFVSVCMNSMNGSWLYLIAYLISFIPSMITFLVFVIPSKTYKQACRKALEKYRRRRR